MLQLTKTFAEQISAQAYLADLFYIIASMATFLIVVALAFIDGGLVARKHLIDTMAQKLMSALIAGASWMVGGYPVWMWQFNQAFGLPNPLAAAFSDWWMLGQYMRTYAHNIDPAVLPGAEVSQIFVIFFFAFAAVFGAFVHSMGLGRMKPSACYVLSAIAGGVMMPILAYLTWGPVSPLTNNGLHDYVGTYALYLFVGTWGLIVAWRLGPRLASTNAFDPGMIGLGVMLLLMAIPFFMLGCGFLEPGIGYFGVTNATSGVGIAFISLFVAFSGGAISGGIIAYHKHKPVYLFFGPIAGYVSCSAFIDIAAPWQCLLVSLIGPWVMLGTKEAMTKLNIDDQKIVPLTLGTGALSVLMAGVIGSGLPAGGFNGATPEYALQHAHISVGMQALGLVVVLAISAVSGLVLVFALEKTFGLRVPRQIEQDGLDEWYWNEWRKTRKMRVSPQALGDGYRGPERVLTEKSEAASPGKA